MLVFLPSSHFCPFYLASTTEEEKDLSERPSPPFLCSDSSVLCDRGKVGLSRCLYLNTHTHTRACVRACALTNTRSLRQIQPALSAQALLEPLFFWRSGTANDTQLSVLETGGGQREERRGKDERRAKQTQQQPPNFCLSCALAHSYAGSVFCSTSGLFFSVPGRRKEEKKKRDWSSHDIIGVNGLPW